MPCPCCPPPCSGSCETAEDCAEGCECVDGECGSPQGPQCCCDETGPRVLNANEECTGTQFPQPDPAKSISLVFEWCGLTAVRGLQGIEDAYYATQNIDLFVCNTTGRYGEEESYTQANSKYLSVTIIEADAKGGPCGHVSHYILSTGMNGVGFKKFGDGNFYGVEVVNAIEQYDCWVRACYDGSEPDVSVDLLNFTTDDTCGGTGCFNPCKYTTPEVTAVIAP